MIELAPMEKTLFFTGMRPKKLGNKCYSWFDLDYQLIVRKMTPVVSSIIKKYSIEQCLIGGALGWDKMAFTILRNLKTEFPGLRIILCIPFEEQPMSWVPDEIKEQWKDYSGTMVLRDFLLYTIVRNTVDGKKPWYSSSIEEYYEMMDYSDGVVYVDELPEYDLSYQIPVGKFDDLKLKNRNVYMATNGLYGVALWDGSNGGTGHCIGVAKTLHRNLVMVNPKNYVITYYKGGI